MGNITYKDGISLAGADGKLVTTAALNDAEGDEVAVSINYTTNKATSGADTGLQIVQTDTASPGTSLLIDAKVGATSKFSVTNAGVVYVTEGAPGIATAANPTAGFGFYGPIPIMKRASYNPHFAVDATGTNVPSDGGYGFSQTAATADGSWVGGAADVKLVRSAAGVVKVTDGSTGIGRLEFEKDKRQFGTHKTPGTAATVTEYGGSPTHTLTGTASNVSDATGHYVQLSGDGAAAGIDLAATECCKTEIDPVVTFIIKTGAALPTDAGERIWVGLASASLAASDSPSGIHVAAFRYAIDTDNTVYWRCVTNDGGADAGTATITTIAIASATRYRLTIDATDSASIKFFINGALAATHTTNLPTVTQALGTTCLTVDAGAGTQEILISKIHYETT